MFFFPENPELLFLHLYHLRLQEAEQTRLVRADQPRLTAKVRMVIANCLDRAKAFNPTTHSGASADTIGKEPGTFPQ